MTRIPGAESPDSPVAVRGLPFFFSDIEGSTRQYERFPDAMGAAIARHYELVSQAVEAHNGRIFNTAGDSVCAVFPACSDALVAAVDAHLSLHAETWAVVDPLRIRVAIHVGPAEERGSDYAGRTLHRAARLMSIGHGGQTLLSLTAREALDRVPDGISFRDMGLHRLKDLGEPEHVFQLLHPELRSDFDPLRSLTLLPHNLPRQLSSFVGRADDVAEIQKRLRDPNVHLLTLTGFGGCGKTRLAIQATAEMVGEFADGVWLVELASISDGSLIPNVAASAMGVPEDSSRPILETLTEHLRDKSALLILDNCEHLILESARFARTLIDACPWIKILATSREELKVDGEVTRPIRTLSVSDPASVQCATDLDRSESVQLFLDRAAILNPAFTLTDSNARSISQICWRLEGIPLAIELAAARVKVMSPETIAARLDDRFRLLTGGYRTALRRQQTLRATIDWSYDLISEEERMVLRRLAGFAGGWTLEAAETVCAGDGIDFFQVLDLMTHLVEKSLVISDVDDSRSRYRLLESIREYCLERLIDAKEAERVRIRHRDYFLDLAESAAPHLRTAEQPRWLAVLAAEHDNFRAAMEWSLGESSDQYTALRLSAALWRYLLERGHLSEGRTWLQQTLDGSPAADRATRAAALQGLGTLAYQQSDWPAARQALEESLGLWREIGDADSAAGVLNPLGAVAIAERDFDCARVMFEQNRAIRESQADALGAADCRVWLGTVARWQGDYTGALGHFEAALREYEQQNQPHRIPWAVEALGVVLHEQGQYEAALPLYNRAVDLAHGNPVLESHCLLNRGNMLRSIGDLDAAESDLNRCFAMKTTLSDRQGKADCLTNLAVVHIEQSRFDAAEEMLAVAEQLYVTVKDESGLAAILEARARLIAKTCGDQEDVRRFLSDAAGIRKRIRAELPPNERNELEVLLETLRTKTEDAPLNAVFTT